MDLLQIITGLLCIGAIVCLAYQIKELHQVFKNTDNFKDFLSNNDYDNQKLKVELDILQDKYLSLKKEYNELNHISGITGMEDEKTIDRLKDENKILDKVIADYEKENYEQRIQIKKLETELLDIRK